MMMLSCVPTVTYNKKHQAFDAVDQMMMLSCVPTVTYSKKHQAFDAVDR